MPLCGSSKFCGCSIVSTPAVTGEINGELPTIDVAGAGTGASPWNLTLNDGWAAEAASLLTNVANIKAAVTLTAQSTASTSYVDLATAGPSVSCETGTSALVFMQAYCDATVAAGGLFVAVAVSGASTIAATGDILYADPNSAPDTGGGTLSGFALVTGLTAGTNVFTLKYKVSSGVTGTFATRRIAVLPLP